MDGDIGFEAAVFDKCTPKSAAITMVMVCWRSCAVVGTLVCPCMMKGSDGLCSWRTWQDEATGKSPERKKKKKEAKKKISNPMGIARSFRQRKEKKKKMLLTSPQRSSTLSLAFPSPKIVWAGGRVPSREVWATQAGRRAV